MKRTGSSPVHPAIFESLLPAPHRDLPLERLDSMDGQEERCKFPSPLWEVA